MVYRLPSERITLEYADGPYAGLAVEVERCGAWVTFQSAVAHGAAVLAATAPGDQFGALRDAIALFVDEAQPTWEIADHRGPIPATRDGMLRLDLSLQLGLISQWAETYQGIEQEQETTAVDEIIPPGELRDELNARLRAKREAA